MNIVQEQIKTVFARLESREEAILAKLKDFG